MLIAEQYGVQWLRNVRAQAPSSIQFVRDGSFLSYIVHFSSTRPYMQDRSWDKGRGLADVYPFARHY